MRHLIPNASCGHASSAAEGSAGRQAARSYTHNYGARRDGKRRGGKCVVCQRSRKAEWSFKKTKIMVAYNGVTVNVPGVTVRRAALGVRTEPVLRGLGGRRGRRRI